MGCNARNHAPNCPCGFGGDTGGGGWSQAGNGFYGGGQSRGWMADGGGTVASYVNPNAYCPVCSEPVYFYRSPYNGRVFFDALGPPWPKHPCTDNDTQPRARSAAAQSWEVRNPAAPSWIAEGWKPLYYLKVRGLGRDTRVQGVLHDDRMELSLLKDDDVDSGPVYVRPLASNSDLFEIAYLRSDQFGTNGRTALAFNTKLAKAGRALIERAASSDPAALAELGRFLLYELEEPERARPYLERALAGGVTDVLIDLAIIALFGGAPR